MERGYALSRRPCPSAMTGTMIVAGVLSAVELDQRSRLVDGVSGTDEVRLEFVEEARKLGDLGVPVTHDPASVATTGHGRPFQDRGHLSARRPAEGRRSIGSDHRDRGRRTSSDGEVSTWLPPGDRTRRRRLQGPRRPRLEQPRIRAPRSLSATTQVDRRRVAVCLDDAGSPTRVLGEYGSVADLVRLVDAHPRGRRSRKLHAPGTARLWQAVRATGSSAIRPFALATTMEPTLSL